MSAASGSGARIIVVEDEKSIAQVITYNLEKEGYQVRLFKDGAQAWQEIQKEIPDLLLLDWMVPGMDGLEICRQVRAHPRTAHVPVIMLTAKTQETDKIVGLEMGADDYIPKPFSPRELTARVKAVLRRSKPAQAASALWRCWNIEADWERRIVKIKGKPVEMARKEFELLHVLADAHGRVLSRDRLLEKVWGYDQAEEIQSRTVDLHVSQLRQKLGADGKRILTVTGSGYRFQMPDEE